MPVPSCAGSGYFLIFIDDELRYVKVSLLKIKDEVKNTFMKFKAAIENHLDKNIKALRIDNGLKYLGEEFNKHLEQWAIKREKSCHLKPQQKFWAGRKNCTLAKLARSLLLLSNLTQ